MRHWTRRMWSLVGLVSLGLALSLAAPAGAQLNPVRLKVNKVQNTNTQTTHRSGDGMYRNEQLQGTIYYEIEVANFNAGPLTNVVVKWQVLYDPSEARSHGSGGSSWSSRYMEIVAGEKTCHLGLGQKYSFETEPIQVSNVTFKDSYSGRRSQYGGGVRGHLVEVFVNGRLVTTDVSANDIRQQIEAVKKDSKRERWQR